jgi:response regulator RpfG family c-di-GMP phosphodiesterase
MYTTTKIKKHVHHHQNKKMYEPTPYILMIDDDEDDLEMLSSGLKKKGIKVKTFNSSTKALFYLTLVSGNMELPSLIIMDYNMPARNGYDVLLSIKDNNDTKDIPVAIYSTTISDVLRQQLSIAGAVYCLDKPWNCKEFDSHIQRFQDLFFHLQQLKI